MDCSKITQGLQAVNCGQPAIPGTGRRVILVNYSDLDRNLSKVTDNVISDLILKGTAKAFEFESLDNSSVGTITFTKGTYFSNWQHDLAMRIFAKSETAKKFVNSLNGARVIAIVENKESGPEGHVKYEVYGWDAGLELNEGTSSTEMADLVVYQLTLGSGEISKESSLPKSIFKTDLTQTELMLTSLVAA